jgi:methionine synthase II (cobalamin-independent)
MLVRTLYRKPSSRSVQRLHERAGLRVIFRDEADRNKFAAMFKEALTETTASYMESAAS